MKFSPAFKSLARTTAFASATLLTALPAAYALAQTVTGAADSSGDLFLGVCIGNCSSGAGTLQGIGNTILGLIDGVAVPLLFAVAFIVFLYGVFKYFILGGADESSRESGRSLILWGLIGFFVMFAVWGLVNVLISTFGLNSDVRPAFPTL